MSKLLLGDVSGDGTLSLSDAVLILQDVAAVEAGKPHILTADQLRCADVDGDGKVTNEDATLIIAAKSGKITKFPAGPFLMPLLPAMVLPPPTPTPSPTPTPVPAPLTLPKTVHTDSTAAAIRRVRVLRPIPAGHSCGCAIKTSACRTPPRSRNSGTPSSRLTAQWPSRLGILWTSTGRIANPSTCVRGIRA